jgi:hypothetical protein
METCEKGSKSHVGIVHFEKRKYPRFTIDLPIEYDPADIPGNHPGRAVNASEGGLLIVLPERVEVGRHLKLKLFFASDAGFTTIQTLVQVAWADIHLGADWGDYATGVRFVDISAEDLMMLKGFLRSLSRQ